MILRKPKGKADCEFIAACYDAWPESKKGPVFPSDVRTWIKNYARYPEQGLIGEVDGEPVGFVLYAQNFFVAKIYDMVVPLEQQGKGYASSMWRTLKDTLVADGVVVAEFDALPGLIADLTLKGRFKKIGETVGEHTGLPIVQGQVTFDMEV